VRRTNSAGPRFKDKEGVLCEAAAELCDLAQTNVRLQTVE